ncbi:MAG: transketolase [Methanosarcinaceae archaeon]
MKKMKLNPELSQKCVNTIKLLAIEGVQKAKSGHPGMPMGTADLAFVLWSRFLNFHPADPNWPNRDRFVLSAGHGSMLLYSLLHLHGYDLSLDDLKNFRQWNSKTPGHPEYKHTPGVETTTGPLGQGFATGIGLALAAKMMQARFNTTKQEILNHKIYAIVGDGDLMEGITAEAASLAGHLQLGNIIYIYDDNHITIEGNTGLTFSENVSQRFQAYGWQTIVVNGHDHEAIAHAIEEGQEEFQRPTLIIARTRIAKGSPNFQDSAKSHGSPLGDAEIRLIKKNMGWDENSSFEVPEDVRQFFQSSIDLQKLKYEKWQKNFVAWQETHPNKAQLWREMHEKQLPENLAELLIQPASDESLATRVHSGRAIQQIASLVPGFCGGSADLAPSNNTFIKNEDAIDQHNFEGRNIHFGIREHAMGAILNGLALSGAFIPFGGTFLVFSDYMRGAIRLAALMKLQVVYVFTHDSIFLGEDGPTHQPVEHLASLQLIPNLTVFRPADGFETAAAWAFALKNTDGPTVLALSRQKLPAVHEQSFKPEQIKNGCYIVSDVENPNLVLTASGSEVHTVLEAKEILAAHGYKIRVVSIPALKLFLKQPKAFQESVIPSTNCRVVAVEAGVTDLWYGIAGRDGLLIGVNSFGASAPADVLAEKFSLKATQIARKVLDWLA